MEGEIVGGDKGLDEEKEDEGEEDSVKKREEEM